MPAARPRRTVSRGAVALLAASLTGLGTLSGCSFGAEEESPRPVVAFLGGADGGSLHYDADADALRDALRADCEDCEYAAFDADGDADLQAEQMTQMLEGGADVVLLEAVDADAGEELVAQAGEVPVITMDRFVEGAEYHVGYDPRRAGRQLSRTAIAAARGTEGAAGVLLLGAGRGDRVGRAATRAARTVLTRQDAEVFAEDTPDEATAQEAQAWTADQLAQRAVEDVDLVVAVGETQAAGVVAAYDDADVPPAERPAIVGTGADLESLRRLITEEQAGALLEPRAALVSRVVATAAEVLEGAPVTDTVEVDGVPSFLGMPEAVTLRTLTTVVVAGGDVTIEELCDGETADACAQSGIS